MSISLNTPYRRCSRLNINVSLAQTEGQCREAHRCEEGPCPLEGKFGREDYAWAIRLLMPSLTGAGPAEG
jgi:hypothetical protein